MTDFLLENQAARKVIRTLGLPLPVPSVLTRAKGPLEARPLDGKTVAVGSLGASPLLSPLAEALARAGASPLAANDDVQAAFAAPGEAYGHPARAIDVDGSTRIHALVFDASALQTPADLRHLYDFVHPLVRRVGAGGRFVVLGRDPTRGLSATVAATQAGLEGFVRSLAREVGKRGQTAHVVYVGEGAASRIEGPLRFLLSTRSAFVSGQPFTITADVRPPAQVQWTRPLERKVALVTGAGRGIGAATARLLADEGAHVVCLDRPADDALVSRVAREVGGSVLLADVADPDAPTVIASALAEHGGVDVVVHNAGITRDKTLANMKPEQWDQTLAINLAAIVRITDALLAGPLHDEGRLVLLSSVTGIAGNVGQTNYSASKAGILGYVRALAPTLRERGITVNAVAPGFIETRLTEAIPLVLREAARRLSNLGQGGLPRDVGDAITFLASPGTFGITGRVVRVCGGAFVGA